MRQLRMNDASAVRRRVYFDVRAMSDGVTPRTEEAGGQPQVSVNGDAWSNTGIGTLQAIGQGRYYASLDSSLVQQAGDVILSRYKGTTTVDTPGEPIVVVAFDPTDPAALGLTALQTSLALTVRSQVADASPTASGFVAATGLATTDDFYTGAVLVFTSGTLAGIARRITRYVGSTRRFEFLGEDESVDAPFPTAPGNGQTFAVLGRIG